MKNEILNTKDRKYYLFVETRTAYNLLILGINSLKRIPTTIEKIHVPIFILSNAFERILKCLLCLFYFDSKGEFGKNIYDRRKGHDLNYLWKRFISFLSEDVESKKFKKVQSGIDSLMKDKVLAEIINILSDFGEGARYYNFDVVLDGCSRNKNPIQTWDALEMRIFHLRGKRIPPRDKLNQEIRNEIAFSVLRFADFLMELLGVFGIKDLRE